MDADEIAKKLRHVRDLEIASDESGEGRTPLTDAIRNAIPFMTPDEIRATLFRALDRLDAQNEEKLARDGERRREHEAHQLELANAEARYRAELEAERAQKSKAISERDKVISEQNKEISRLKKALAAKEAEAE
ncbi:MAG: hypothetical protein NC453_23485, partial [Muribaculum sp.]|nr:hypothetical protein [Muribaculum sp.]